ncbi:unnamed protein product [Ceutorhynchus assimilis]|uniref:Uncharacterized protein n=1 Tax=Ceutorhynchus assimilis TaxID=467358 RepID=A0A9N9MF68_9CUCU|nr:unnamed protein product [Ceutorhynchus assimilis]
MSKDEIISLLKKKIEDLESTQKNPNQMGMSYSNALTSSVKQSQSKLTNYNYNLPSLIIKPMQNQTIKKIESDLKLNIKPFELKIAIGGTRSTSNGNIIVKCQNKQDLKALKREADMKLSGYEIQIPELKKPRIKITGYDGTLGKQDLVKCIREQNKFINMNDELKITFVKKIRDRFTVLSFSIS